MELQNLPMFFLNIVTINGECFCCQKMYYVLIKKIQSNKRQISHRQYNKISSVFFVQKVISCRLELAVDLLGVTKIMYKNLIDEIDIIMFLSL